MNVLGARINYKQLLSHHQRIRVPMIQRDYAQGRPAEAEVRDEFLGALERALKLPPDDPTLPLNLDFIYGSVEGKDKAAFCPLDGQQRLTTLFLLHWYLAWADNRWNEFEELFRSNGHARFSYAVRPSSSEFFDQLVAYQPTCRPADLAGLELSRLIQDQPWYFRNWRLDPTIQSTLVMLDAIHSRFAVASGLFERLTSGSRPAITFQLLDLENFGLSDDLYIKMNGRGKPLTPFETFKARYEQVIERQFKGESRRIGDQEFSTADFVARRMDTQWSDLFWSFRDKETNTFDDALMNVLRAVALVTRDPESKEYIRDISRLRAAESPPSYSDFDNRNWLDRNFTETLICLLESWSGGSVGALEVKLPDNKFFDERAIFSKLIAGLPGLSYTEVVQFAAYAGFLREHAATLDSEVFQEWMRVVHNLVVNSNIERSDDLRSSVRGMRELLPKSKYILEHLSELTPKDHVTGFSPQQVEEEKLKAGLMLAHGDWRHLIERAESHGYFRGQIEFLLDFSGVLPQAQKAPIGTWESGLHAELQGRFGQYLEKALLTFNANGLAPASLPDRPYLWQRALLATGDYLIGYRHNRSFLTDGPTNWDSWKRFLRDGGASSLRQFLKALWDRIDADAELSPQLESVISAARTLEPWRAAAVKWPQVIEYCEKREIRWNSPHQVYLLKKQQMNGAHAELFSYVLHQELKTDTIHQGIAPFQVEDYHSVSTIEEEPHVLLSFKHPNGQAYFAIGSSSGQFRVSVNKAALSGLGKVESILKEEFQFLEDNEVLALNCARGGIHNLLRQLAHSLANLPEGSC